MNIKTITQKLLNGQKLNKDELQYLLGGLSNYSSVDVAKLSVDEINKYYDDILKNAEAVARELGEMDEFNDSRLSILESQRDTLREKLDLMIETGDYSEEELKSLQKQYKLLTDEIKQIEAFQSGMQKGAAAAESLLQTTIGLSTEWGLLGKKGGAAGVLKGFIKNISKAATFTNITTSIISMMFQRLFEYDEVMTATFTATGIKKKEFQLQKLVDDINSKTNKKLSAEMYQLASGQFISLQQNMLNFMDATDTQRNQIIKTGMVMQAFGISTETSSRAYEQLVNTFKYTREDADSLINNFRGVAEALRRPPDQLMRAFNSQAPVIARFGKAGIDVFYGMQIEAKRLAIESGKLLTFSERVDTIEGAARVAQAFNAATGVPFLSAHALLAASPEHKAKIIGDLYQKYLATGGTPITDPRVMRGLAQAAQMGVDEVQRILTMGQQNVESDKKKVEAVATTQDDNLNMAVDNASFLTQLSAQMKALIDKLLAVLFGDDKMQGILNLVKTLATKMKSILAALGGLAALKTVVAVASARGATPYNPMFVTDIMGGGKLGKVLGGLGLAAGAVGVGVAGMGASDVFLGTSFFSDDAEDELDLEAAKAEVAHLGDITNVVKVPGVTSNAKPDSKTTDITVNTRKGDQTALRFGSPSQAQSAVTSASRAASSPARTVGTRSGGTTSGGARRAPIAGGPAAPIAGGPAAGLKVSPSAQVNAAQPVELNDSMVSPNVFLQGTDDTSNYIHPVFNKSDMFYAAKKGGPLDNALEHVLDILKSLQSEKNQPVILSTNEIEFGTTVQESLMKIRRRPI